MLGDNKNMKIKSALISVSDKSKIEDILPILQKYKINLISSGGTYNKIKSLGYKVIADGEDFWKSNKGDWVCSNPPYYTARKRKS